MVAVIGKYAQNGPNRRWTMTSSRVRAACPNHLDYMGVDVMKGTKWRICTISAGEYTSPAGFNAATTRHSDPRAKGLFSSSFVFI